MCQLVYLACSTPLPPVPWREEARDFNVAPLQPHEERVRGQFSLPHVYYLGSHLRCGCGFIKEGATADERRDVAAVYAHVAAYLRTVLQQGASVELFVCWEGDEGTPPEHRRTITPDELHRPAFAFEERVWYDVRDDGRIARLPER